ISVTLVKPGSIDTPLFDKARTYLGVEPQPVPPVYAPEVVAEGILECAQRQVRDIVVGGMGRVLGLANLAPRLADRYMEHTTFESQKTERQLAEDRRDNLYEVLEHDGGERGRNWKGRPGRPSLYTKAALHWGEAAVTAALGVILAVAGPALSRAYRRSGS